MTTTKLSYDELMLSTAEAVAQSDDRTAARSEADCVAILRNGSLGNDRVLRIPTIDGRRPSHILIGDQPDGAVGWTLLDDSGISAVYEHRAPRLLMAGDTASHR
ncbi:MULTISPECIES: hypothetical protein [unclassified Curtobacterium]|uniref:hypothetical protein n=1 Tax=unclassified Curtobacterium TaxID=257496 RepID=UPI0008DD3F05|nr:MULTISPECIES: hypothetical protein [unclassified Curtobacterium]WIA96977.1 hypothetical protein QOL16_00910 [Curtobacterium sp. MCBA15_004]WIB00283.1 hypothetical protein QOL15_00940 [Curtobacterium sp. MCBA15_012]